MDYKAIRDFIASLLDDEAAVARKELGKRGPKPIDSIVGREAGRPFCRACGAQMAKNGHDGSGHQKWICAGCGQTVSGSSGHVSASSKLTGAQWVDSVSMLIAGAPLRQAAAVAETSVKTAFAIRHRLFEAISGWARSVRLSGAAQIDADIFRINLKGFKKHQMPRHSKKRGGGSTDPTHKAVVFFAIDEEDRMVGLVAGQGPERAELAAKLIPYLEGATKIESDDRRCYDWLAKAIGASHETVKSTTKSNENGMTLAEVNGLISDFDTWMRRFKGVGTRHLQSYVDFFLFRKAVLYAAGYGGIMAKTISESFRREARIKVAEITKKAMPVDLFRAYGSYHFGIFGPGEK